MLTNDLNTLYTLMDTILYAFYILIHPRFWQLGKTIPHGYYVLEYQSEISYIFHSNTKPLQNKFCEIIVYDKFL